MLFVAQSNLIALVLGLLIGLIVAYWAFRAGRTPPADAPAEPQPDETNPTETPLP